MGLAFWHRIGSPLDAPLVAGPMKRCDVKAAAITGVDFPKVRPVLAVAKGDAVHAGDVLFRDRAHPEICWVAPLSGTVDSIDFAPRRMLSSVVIAADQGEREPPRRKVDVSTVAALRATLLERGLWPAFQSRPFGHVPDPGESPDAILIVATETEPWAPDPMIALQDRKDLFAKGAQALTLLTGGPVHLCLPSGHGLGTIAGARLRTSEVAGRHPEGLAGTHLRRLGLGATGGPVWTIGYQDVVAVGHLLETGEFLPERIISIGGPNCAKPRLVQTVIGGRIADLAAGAAEPEAARAISGSVFSGRESAWLGYRHRQISLIARAATASQGRRRDRTGGDGPSALVPTSRLEAGLPFGLPVVPLLRALAVGDAEAAERLGCRDLIEEDVALLSALCTSGADYGPLLRRVLDELEDSA